MNFLRPLFHCHGLKDLSLADNEVGQVPSAVSSLAGLVSLDVSKNVLIDLPDTIKQCKHLAIIQVKLSVSSTPPSSFAHSLSPGRRVSTHCRRYRRAALN